MYNGVLLGCVISFLKGSRTLFQAISFLSSSVILKSLFENVCFAMHTEARHRMRRPSGLSCQQRHCLPLRTQMWQRLCAPRARLGGRTGWKEVGWEKTQRTAAGKDLLPSNLVLKGFYMPKSYMSGRTWYPCFTNLSLLELLSAQRLDTKWVLNANE